MLTKSKSRSLPIQEKDLNSFLYKTIPNEVFPVGLVKATDFIIHHHGNEDSCTDFYSVYENNGDFVNAKGLGRLWHSGFQQDDYHFVPPKSQKNELVKFYGGFYGIYTGFINSIQSTSSPNGVVFIDIPLSKFYIRGNSIPIEIKDKVEIVNARILSERARLTSIQKSKNFKYGWIHYKLQEFMQNYRQEVCRLFEDELYFYFPQNPIYGDRYNFLPVIDAIKYIET